MGLNYGCHLDKLVFSYRVGQGHYLTCQKFSGETEQEGGIMTYKMASLLLDEQICFIRLPPDTLQNFWQIIRFI
jgi:hypothetical protein